MLKNDFKFQNSRSNLILERIVLSNLICQLCPNDSETNKDLWDLLFHLVVEHKKVRFYYLSTSIIVLFYECFFFK